MRRILILSLALILAVPLTSPGEVFTLWPWKGGTSPRPRIDTLAGISEQTVFSEPILVNGLPLELSVSRGEQSFDLLLEQLRNDFRPGEIDRIGRDTLRLTYQLKNGDLDRRLLVASPDGKITVFRLIAPATPPPPPEWPRELPPLPAGAKTEQVIRFPKRNAVYGSFSGAAQDPVTLHRQTADRLRSEGWQPVGNEADTAIGGNGDLFVHSNPPGLLWVSASPDGHGALYYRPR